MNEDFVAASKNVQEICLNVDVNLSRLPLIVVQTPAEVEAGLPSYFSSGETARNEENIERKLNKFHSASLRPKTEVWDPEELSRNRIKFESSTLDSARNINSIQLSRNNNTSIEFNKNKWIARDPARKGRWCRTKTKKDTANEQKYVVEDALSAFKKMKLNSEETEDYMMD